MLRIYIIGLFAVLSFTVNGQSLRSLINNGVEHYESENYTEAEVNFRKGLEENVESFEGHFNLGDALYKQERYDDALKQYQNALAVTEDSYLKSKVYHNIGNSLLKSQKLDESIEAYKNALKLDPNDMETKYNLSYAQKLKKDQENQQNKDQNQKQKNDQNKDQNKDKNQQNQQNQDQNKDDQDKQDQNQNDKQDQQNKDQQNQNGEENQDKNKEQQGQQQQPQPQQISKEEARRILEALKNNEAELQKELRKRKGKVVPKAKDW